MITIRSERTGILRAPLHLFTWLALASGALAQASYFEGFESAGFVNTGDHGPDGLIAAGWEFRNQSDPVSSQHWRRWNYSYQGSYALHVDQTVGQWFNFNDAEASSWAILPAIPGQVAGDPLRFLLSSASVSGFTPTAHLEIRYSPSGLTDTGSNPDDVGDFTALLLDIPDPQTHLWTEYSLTLPGNGRLAMRFRIPPAATQEDFFGNFQIDNLSVGDLPGGPPIPGPGETVRWTLDMSPISISEITTIPAGGTVIVEPGVIVELETTVTLTLEGDLIATGVAGQPVTLQGAGRIDLHGGLDLQTTSVNLRIDPHGASSFTCRDVSFLSGAFVFSAGVVGGPAFMDFDGCSFAGPWLRVSSCILRLTNTTFTDAYLEIQNCNFFLDNVTVDGAPWQGLVLIDFLQPVYLDGVAITNSGGTALDILSVNLLLGPNVALLGNQYPARTGGGGFLPGTSLPATGNVNDYVSVEDASIGLINEAIWSDVGVPYVIVDTYTPGPLQILPGARVQLGPGTTFWGPDSPIVARGTPASPVIFERFDPAQAWQGLQYFRRFENCIIDGGEVGARFHSNTSNGFIDNCIIRNNEFGMQNDAIVRKTRFVNNVVGAWDNDWPTSLDGATGANSFEGNGIAVQFSTHLIDAPNNWWGDPSGPNSPDNPGGQGDAADVGVTTVPFLTAPPDFTDHPPLVRLHHHSGLLEPNSKMILTWSSQDDVAVVAHRIEFDHPLEGTNTTIVAAGLPGQQQAYEWTVPDIGYVVNGKAPVIRVVAIDSAGQEGWDASEHLIPSGEVQGTLEILTDLTGPFVAGTQAGQVCWNPIGINPTGAIIGAAMVFEADRTSQPLGGVTSYLSCLSGSGLGIPFISTDTARLLLTLRDGSVNRVKHFYSEPFEIRPDTRLGDEPPSITMFTPHSGQTFTGGSNVEITWFASDDEALRAFHVQATYDAGHTWHFIAEDLPASASGYTWNLPASSGLPDVRVRVVAVDQRFQNTSDGADRAFRIVPSAVPGPSRHKRDASSRRP